MRWTLLLLAAANTLFSEEGWMPYKGTFGNDTVSMEFPGQPDEKEIYGVIKVSSNEGAHRFITSKTPKPGMNADEYFKQIVEEVSRDFKIDSQKQGKKDNYDYLDLTYTYAKPSKSIWHRRIIVTKNNVYSLITIDINGKEPTGGEKFLETFKVEP